MRKRLLIAIAALLTLTLLAVAVILFGDTLFSFLSADKTGWSEENGTICYLDANGDAVTGLQVIQNNTYYFDPDTGAMATGWVDLPEGRSCFGRDGVRLTGWVDAQGSRCYIGPDGYTLSGWCKLEDGLFFLQDGMICTGWQQIDGQRYHFDANGAMSTGWLMTAEGRYFLTGEGLCYSGWLTDATGTYYLDAQGLVTYGWQEVDGKRYYLDENGLLQSGWLELEGLRYYTAPDGSAVTGWQELEGLLLYLNEDSSLHTGWLEWEGQTYYLLEDGTKAIGKQTIGEETYYFTSTGANILLVNPWSHLPEDHEVELAELEDGHKVAKACHDALVQMLADCRAAGHDPLLHSSYRTHDHQQQLFDDAVRQEGSEAEAVKLVAAPGTSEHQLGLAVDIIDSSYRKLDRKQGTTETQKWLMENCWKYGFILRYPDDATDITGIDYKPWHYRYVGLELARELKEKGLCLEEYLDQLTGDGSTCGDPHRK